MQVVVVDECFMLGAPKFKGLLKVMSAARERNPALQLILAGDPDQLDPIEADPIQSTDEFRECTFLYLEKILRQTGEDSAFRDTIGVLASGVPTPASVVDFIWKLRSPHPAASDTGFSLYTACTQNTVQQYNRKEMAKLAEPETSYQCVDSGDHALLAGSGTNLLASVELRAGAQVMLVYNVDTSAGLVNGKIGRVTSLTSSAATVEFSGGREVEIQRITQEVVDSFTGEVLASRNQLPLVPAWAITVHKVQSLTLTEPYYIDFRDAFGELEQKRASLYTAISRASRADLISLALTFKTKKQLETMLNAGRKERRDLRALFQERNILQRDM